MAFTSLITKELAERVGFEPTLPFRVNTLSKRAPSATRPSLPVYNDIRGLCSEKVSTLRRKHNAAFRAVHPRKTLPHNISPSTVSWYTHALKWLPSESPTPAELQETVIRMREKGLKATGCNAAIRAINAYLHWSSKGSRKCGAGCEHPRIASLKEPQFMLPTFTAAQVQRLIAWKPRKFYDRRLHLLVMVLLDTGCRITEALTLRVRDVDNEQLACDVGGYAARGKITGLSGEPDAGKSLVSLDWAARFSTGRGWPEGTAALQPPGKVLIFATEDDAADTILPRFLSAGGNPEKLLRLRLENDRGFYFDDPGHLDILRCVTEQHADIGMVIIDPILEHLRVNKEQTTREAFAPLRVLIAQRNIALLQVVHTNKRSADNVGSVGDKIGGVKALVGMPRFVYSVHKTEDSVHHLCRIKQNVGRTVRGSMDFRIVETKGQPVVEWIGRGTATAQDALTKKTPDCGERLLALLQDGDNDSDMIRGTLTDVEGFSLSQTQRAVARLRVDRKLDVVKMGDRKTVWRKMTAATDVVSYYGGARPVLEKPTRR
jgi:hypothetical protein